MKRSCARLLLFVLLAAASAACSNKEDTTAEKAKEVFGAEVLNVGSSGATIRLTHKNGDAGYKWIYLLTTDFETPAGELLAAAKPGAEEILPSDSTTVELSGLSPRTAYRWVACGYSGDKTLHGVPADISFETQSLYMVNPAWTLSYDGRTGSDPKYPFVCSNTASADSGSYLLFVVPKADVSAQADIHSFLEGFVPSYLDYLKGVSGRIPEELLHKESASESFRLGFEDYFLFALGIADDGSAAGPYASLSFSVKPRPEDYALYEAWTGTWIVPRGTSEDVWTVDMSDAPRTYKVLGVEDGLFDEEGGIEAEFDAVSGHLQIYAQQLYDYESGSYGTVTVNLLGNANNSFYSGDYLIADIVLSEDGKSAEMIPGSVTSSSGVKYTISGFEYRGRIKSGTYAGQYLSWSSGPVGLPGTMNRPGEAGDDYKAWLGTWSVPRGTETDTWIIRQAIPNVSYSITGIEGMDEYRVFNASFDRSSGELAIPAQKDVFTYDQDNVSVSDWLLGIVERDGRNIRITGSYDLCRASFTGKSAASLTAGTVSLDFGTGVSDYPLVGMWLFAVNADTQSVLGNYNDDFTTFPATITRTGDAAAPAKMVRRGKASEVRRPEWPEGFYSSL